MCLTHAFNDFPSKSLLSEPGREAGRGTRGAEPKQLARPGIDAD